MNDLVSIIMPSYNTGMYICKSVQSVINQSYSNWELLIVDDCSSDDTDEVIKPFLSDTRIKYYKNSKNCGAAYSRNRALREANGRWIAFLDSDDLWNERKLEKQIAFMEEKGCYFSYTNYSEIDSDGSDNGIVISGPPKITKIGFYKYCWPGCLTVMYDSWHVGLIQIADIRKNNDYAMWLKVCRKADCYLLNEDLAFYRRGRTGSISTQSIITMIGWHYRLFRVSEGKNVVSSVLHTLVNIFFGVYKKVRYIKNETK